MSSGKIQEKMVHFEVNSNGVVGELYIFHIDGDGLNPDKIYMKMATQTAAGNGVSSSNTTSIVIPKTQTKVLANWFREAAKIADEWYKEKNDV
jgi:hypothetical protein